MSFKIKTNCLKFSSALLFLLIFQFAYSQGNKKQPKEIGINEYSNLDAVFQKNAKALGNDAVALLWKDTLVYKRELGEFDTKSVTEIDAASSWLTAALIMKLVEEGKLSLDDKVGQYIPIYETYGKSYITIRHCLTHFTGIQSDNKLFSKKKFSSLEDEVNSYAKKEIQTNPGTEFRYSEIGFNIAGRIAEIVSKKKFDMLAKQKLFNPLGMRKSTFSNLDGSAIDPAGGAKSSAEEMLRFIRMLLDNGKYNGQTFLSEESIKELRMIYATSVPLTNAPKTTEGYGYAPGSWVLEEGNDKQATALSGVAFSGTWTLVDWCRGYAFVLMTKSASGEKKKELYLPFKEAIDEKHASKCE